LQGWFDTNSFDFAGPDGNTSYLAGVFNNSSYKNFFVFNLAGVNSPVTSAKVDLYAGTITSELDYSLFGTTVAITALSDGVSPDLTVYNQLATGVKYGSFTITSNNSLQNLIFTLNAAAVGNLNAAILGKKTQFEISGSAERVPEPSTWIMMLAGFAGLGLAGYRRAAKGRSAASAA
jgi:hypothetical protein